MLHTLLIAALFVSIAIAPAPAAVPAATAAACAVLEVQGSSPVPEPATLALVGSGLLGLALWRRHSATHRKGDIPKDRSDA